MISISDLAKLYETVQSAQSDQEKRRRAGELDDSIEAHIRSLFDDPQYPRRRRSFGIIRKGLPIFDEEPKELQRHLIRIGAHRAKGEGDDELWHLPPKNGRRWWPDVNWVRVGALAAIIATGVAVLQFIEISDLGIMNWFNVEPPPEIERTLIDITGR